MLIVAPALSLLVALVATSAQPQAKLARIAFIELTPAPSSSALPPHVAAFQQRLRELGWVEGQNLTIEWRWAEGSLERFTTLVEEMVHLQVDVMMVPNQITAELAQKATTTISIFVVGAGSLAQTVPNLAQPRSQPTWPGGNITGFAGLGPELASKRLELLTHVSPGLTRVAVLRGLAPATRELQAMEVAARALGVQPQLLQARDPTEIDQAFAAAIREGAGALMVFRDGGSALAHRAQIADLALTHRLPSILNGRAFVEAGGLMSYGPSPSEQGQRIAAYVDKILKGAKPGDPPIEQPTTFELVINLKTAQALGLTIPPTLLFQATEVIRCAATPGVSTARCVLQIKPFKSV
jgi:putative ABC transport system substrate-binding protein